MMVGLFDPVLEAPATTGFDSSNASKLKQRGCLQSNR
jgi:hypothetical protein